MNLNNTKIKAVLYCALLIKFLGLSDLSYSIYIT